MEKNLRLKAFNPFSEQEASLFRYKELLNRKMNGCKEWIFGVAELPVKGKIPLHIHRNDYTIYILAGSAKVQLGVRALEIEPCSAAYFPAQKPFSIESLGPEPLRYLYTYVCEEEPQRIDWTMSSESVAVSFVIENNPLTRWALHEEFEKWQYWEPTKGSRLRYRILFDQEHGNTCLGVSIYSVGPHTHYTRHFHNDPMLYYILSGQGIMYLGNSEHEIKQGSAMYIESNVIHGLDNTGNEPLKCYCIFGTELVDGWTPVEDVYTNVR